MEQTILLEAVLQLAKQLSAYDKACLIECLAVEIERDSRTAQPRKSLRGLWKGAEITDEDIAEIRREMWTNFPRSDI